MNRGGIMNRKVVNYTPHSPHFRDVLLMSGFGNVGSS